jgi:peptidoglycan/xylan/chitin deacetylase (PgdA/CDA1 family)
MRSVSGRVAGGLRGRIFGAAVFLVPTIFVPAFAAAAETCPGHPDALGTSRTIVVDPTEHPNVGTMQYSESIPLSDHEVVITFDDGPLPRNSGPILDILDAECVKATYFMVGQMALAYPKEAKQIQERGHTIGTHSFSHPLTFHRMSEEEAGEQIDKGIAAVGEALGDPKLVAPFFRIPGLLKSKAVEEALNKRGLMNWSADFPADDWKHISAAEVAKRALSRLEAKGRGVLLLHDIHANTRAALPVILRELKRRGYKVVHVVPADASHIKTATLPEEWIMRRPKAVAPAAVADTAAPDAGKATETTSAEKPVKHTKQAVAQRKETAAPRVKRARAERAHKNDENKPLLSRHVRAEPRTSKTATRAAKRAHGEVDDFQFGHELFGDDGRSTQSIEPRQRRTEATPDIAKPVLAKPEDVKPAEAKSSGINFRAPLTAAAALFRPIIP